ncbi:MAG: hypothetical protein ABIY35_00825 [Chitinophagaceae bacterium]
MTNFASLLILPQSFTIVSVVGAGLAGIISGVFIKYRILAKQRKRILDLEDEMLKNHARILKLEKKNTQLKEDSKNGLGQNIQDVSKQQLKLIAS